MRIQIHHLENQFNRYVRAAVSLGFDTRGWQLSEGSKTQGTSYQLGKYREAGTRLPGTFDGGKIGQTRREAHDALEFMAQTMEDTARQMGLTD